MTETTKSIWRQQEFKLILAWLAVIVFTYFADPTQTYRNSPWICAQELLRQTIFLSVFALGAAVIIIAGGIDLSSGSMIALSATCFALVMQMFEPTPTAEVGAAAYGHFLIGLGSCLLLGFFVGTFNAWLITKIGLQPFVATLATLVGLRSLAWALAISGTGTAQIRMKHTWISELLKSPVTLLIILAVLGVSFWFMMSRTVIGRRLHAMGGNEQAALLSGIRTDRLKWLAYCLGSMTAALMGILLLAYTTTADPYSDAMGYELNAIAAAVIGGCSLKGGIGTMPGTVLGCLFISTVIDSIGKVLGGSGISSKTYEGLVVGIVVVLAVTFSQKSAAAKRYFADPIGWAAIPFLSLLVGCITLFYKNDVKLALAVGGAALVAFVIRAVWETKQANA
jgi:ribose/xylose/arabinose/galactoside ABC-type transport system permease subunit